MENWQEERAKLLRTIRRQEQDAIKLAKRFRLLQQTLEEQQKLLDKYQTALLQTGYLSPSASPAASNDHRNQTNPVEQTAISSGNDKQIPVASKKRKILTTSSSRESDETLVQENRNRLTVHDKQQDIRRHEHSTGQRLPTADTNAIQSSIDAVDRKNKIVNSNHDDFSWKSRQHSNFSEDVRASPGKIGQRQNESKKQHPQPTMRWGQEKEDHQSHLHKLSSSTSKVEKESAFPFVEVVRNRQARAALPGHDCVECRKYYEAIDGIVPDADMQMQKTKCSRHRARFEPYNTPDDFWRLSFPDSETTPTSP